MNNIKIIRLNTNIKGNAEDIARKFLDTLGGAVYSHDLLTIYNLTNIKLKNMKGVPDLVYWDRKNKVWLVEVKSQGDVISQDQLNFAMENQELQIVFLFVRDINEAPNLKYPGGIDFFEYFLT